MKTINNYVNEKLIINKDTEVLRNNDNELRYDDVGMERERYMLRIQVKHERGI